MAPVIENVDRSLVVRNEPSLETQRQENNAPTVEETTAGVDAEAIRAAVEQNRTLVFGNRSAEFAFNEEINRVVVTVKADETDEVVRQIPAEDYIRFLGQFNELLGVLFDEVA